MPGRSTEIANRFIALAAEQGAALTQMQLQKLVYIAHGWTLALHREPLTEDGPAAWDYGPVYRDLYTALRRYGREPVREPIRYCDYDVLQPERDEPAAADLMPEEERVIAETFAVYGGFPAFKLSALTHQRGTPWDQVYRADGVGRAIPDALIREHFLELANTHPV